MFNMAFGYDALDPERLAEYLGTSVAFWADMQANYERRKAGKQLWADAPEVDANDPA